MRGQTEEMGGRALNYPRMESWEGWRPAGGVAVISDAQLPLEGSVSCEGPYLVPCWGFVSFYDREVPMMTATCGRYILIVLNLLLFVFIDIIYHNVMIARILQ